MKTLLRTTLIYKQAAELPTLPVITQPFCEGTCSGWGQTADAAHWLIIADGFEWSSEWDPKKKILITFIFRPYTMNWSRAFSLPLNEAAVCLEMVSLSCLDQLQMIQQGSTIEGNWMRKKILLLLLLFTSHFMMTYIWVSTSVWVCVIYCKLSLLCNSYHLYGIQHMVFASISS